LPKKACDYPILFSVLLLVSIGIVMVFSASYNYAVDTYNDGYYFFKRQMLWAVLGFAAMVFMMNYDYHKLERWANVLLVLSILLLLAVFIPGVGATINEATRWIKLGPITIQPAEIAKIAMIIYMARSMSKKNDAMKTFSKGVIPYLIIAGIFFIIIVMQPNLSTALTMIMLCFVMMFAAGANIGHLASLLGIGAGAAAYIISSGIIADTYWYKRIMIFRDPFQDTSDTGFQLVQSLYALGSGGLWGVGLGNSRQKQFYLPMPQNDFIFAIICEELGFIGGVTILFIFMFLIWRSLRVAITAKDSFGRLLATGIISIVALQVIMNVAVVTSSMPPTGVPMPFISAGGSSLSISMASMGILLNISKHCEIE
jgi:cell division protein FtsW